MFSTSISCWLIGIGRQEIDLNQFLQYLAKAPFPNWFLARYFFYDGDPYSGTHSLNYLFSVPNNRTFGQVPLLPKNVSFLFISYFYPFNAWWQQKRNIPNQALLKQGLLKYVWPYCYHQTKKGLIFLGKTWNELVFSECLMNFWIWKIEKGIRQPSRNTYFPGEIPFMMRYLDWLVSGQYSTSVPPAKSFS